MPALTMVRPYPLQRPYCNARTLYRHELAYVATVIEALLDVFRGTDIRLEYALGPTCRVDIACFRDGVPTLLLECKSVPVRPHDAEQAGRYLAAAEARWPGEGVRVWLVGPSISPRMPDPPQGISYVAFQ